MIMPEGAKIFVQVLVISNLDYCNTLLLGVSDQQLSKLQKIQEMGYHVINNLGKYDHVTDSMKDLHWLKVPEQNQFKALVTVYQCVKDLAPSFVKDLLNLDLNEKSLRSETHGKLPIPWCRMSQVRDSSIRYAGPRLWNDSPQYIRNAEILTSLSQSLRPIFLRNLMI